MYAVHICMWCWAVVLVSLCGSGLLLPAGIKMNKRRGSFQHETAEEATAKTHREKDKKCCMGKGRWGLNIFPSPIQKEAGT